MSFHPISSLRDTVIVSIDGLGGFKKIVEDSKKEKMTGKWREVYDQLPNSCSTSNFIRTIESMTMG